MKVFQLFAWLLLVLMASFVSVNGMCSGDGHPCKVEADCCTKLCDIRSKTPTCIGD